MTEHDIAYKYVHGLHDALTDNQEKKDMADDILCFAKYYHEKQLIERGVYILRQHLVDCVNFCDSVDLSKYNTVEKQVDSYLKSIKTNKQ